jgi:hypothetical protein
MQRKLDEYFSAGVRLVWIVDADVRTITVHSSRELSFPHSRCGCQICLRGSIANRHDQQVPSCGARSTDSGTYCHFCGYRQAGCLSYVCGA